jgi:hypothetical protein
MTSTRERNMRLVTRGGPSAKNKSMFDARPLFGQVDPAVEYPLLDQSYPRCGVLDEASIPSIVAIARTPSIAGYPNPGTPLVGSPEAGFTTPDYQQHLPDTMPAVALRGYPHGTSIGPDPQAPPSEAMLQAFLDPQQMRLRDFRALQDIRHAAQPIHPASQQHSLKAAGQTVASQTPPASTPASGPGDRPNTWTVLQDGAQVLLDLGIDCAMWSSWTQDNKRAHVSMLASSHGVSPVQTEALITDHMAVADNYCAWAGQYHGTVIPEFLPSPPPTPGSPQEIDNRAITLMQLMRISCNDWQAMTDEQRKSAVSVIAPTLSGVAGASPEGRALIVDQNVALIGDYCVRHPSLIKPWMIWTAAGVAAAGVVGWLVWAERRGTKTEKPRATGGRESATSRVSGVRPVVRESGRPMSRIFGTGR